MNLERVAARANAKLTLSLRVTGVRGDGYHELDALMVAVTEPHDALAVERADVAALTVAGRARDGVPDGETSTVWRAADALGVTASFVLDKGIPTQGGLGGGSADAAAALLALRALYDLDVSDAELALIGARIGADVPFCLAAGAQRVGGIGDELSPTTVPAVWFVVVTPPYGSSTPAVYAKWDELGGPHGTPVDCGIAGLPPLVNDLEPAAHAAEPRLARYRDELEKVAEAPVVLAGSGSSYVAIYEREALALAAARRVDETMGVHSAFVDASTVAERAVVIDVV